MTLLETIQLEFFSRNGYNFCNESFGVIDNLMPILNESKKILGDIIKKNKTVDTFVNIEHPLYKEISNLFPKQIDIHFQYNQVYVAPKGSNKKCSITAVYQGMNGESANIFLKACGKPFYVINRIPVILAHELTHAYEDLNRIRGDVKLGLVDSLNAFYKLAIIIKNNAYLFSYLMRDFADCCYWLNPSERRANLGRLEIELEPYFSKIVDERSATKYIEKLPVYKEFELIKMKLQNIAGREKEIRNELFSVMDLNDNDINKFSLSNINKTIKQLADFLEDFEIKLFRNAANLAYDAVMIRVEKFV